MDIIVVNNRSGRDDNNVNMTREMMMMRRIIIPQHGMNVGQQICLWGQREGTSVSDNIISAAAIVDDNNVHDDNYATAVSPPPLSLLFTPVITVRCYWTGLNVISALHQILNLYFLYQHP